MAKIFLTILLLVIATQSSIAIPRSLNRFQHRIVNGVEVPPGSVPFVVSIQTASGFHYCAGSIVNENWILTAAHCTTGDRPSDVHIHAGVHDIFNDDSGFEQVLAVKTILVHDKYGSSGYGYDVSLLELVTPAQLGADIRVDSIRLATKGFKPTGHATSYGWGRTAPGAGKLQATDVLLVDNVTCAAQYPGQIDETMICAQNGESGDGDSCQADGGGPLVYREVDGERTLIGIMSWGRGCGLDDYATVYTEVQALRDWIDANTS